MAENPSEDNLTKYEKARIIGARALQIAMGAPFMLKLSDKDLKELKYNTVEIAKREFEAGVVPIAIHRRLPQLPPEVEQEKPAAASSNA